MHKHTETLTSKKFFHLCACAGTVIGANAMLGYYTIFDRENKRVGFAESTCDCKYLHHHHATQ